METETQFGEIDAVMLYLEDARARAERAASKLRAEGGEQHLIDALLRAQDEISDVARQLRQGTFFAVPSAQASL